MQTRHFQSRLSIVLIALCAVSPLLSSPEPVHVDLIVKNLGDGLTSAKKGESMERKEVPAEDRWNVEALYPSWVDWEADLKKWGREEQASPRWPEIAAFKGKATQNPATLLSLIEICMRFDRQLSKLYTYAHLRYDEDVAEDLHKKAFSRITSLLNDYREEVSWIEPEILQTPEGRLDELLNAPELKEYQFYLQKIIRLKPHTLSQEMEELLAFAGKSLETAHKAFGAFNNGDLKFPSITDSAGNVKELTHGKYLLYLRDRDRKLREEAFKTVHKSYLAYENTLCELINGQIQAHLFEKKARKYASCLETALFPNQIDTNVYKALIETVRKNLSSLHRYISFRKQLLGYSELHLYDLHLPLVEGVDFKMSYPEGEKLVIASVAPLGKEYQEVLRKGLSEGRWVDRYENARKRSGAYSSGCYDSMPYILMNYQGTLNDVLTLAHEAGHSMHTYLSSHNQPYQYSHYPIFVAEVASTFNEELLLGHLLANEKDSKKRAFLINQKIEDIRSTFFRQTMFAEFELALHEWAEKGIPLTPALLKQEYRRLNQEYFGPDLIIDEEVDGEWARIPHFYYNFYVYQYATGISAAHALIEKVKKEGDAARLGYLKFLSSGSSAYPVDLLKMAGVDMRQPEAVTSIIRYFDLLVAELQKELSK